MARARKKTSKARVSAARKKPVRRLSAKKSLPPSKKSKKTKPKKTTKSISAPARFISRSTLPSAYDISPAPQHANFRPALEIDRRLPQNYGEDRLVLLVRDPWWIFSYWEITPRRAEEVVSRMPSAERGAAITVLRVYDLTDASFDRPVSFFDIELRTPADCWYVDVGTPDRAWGAEIGFRLPDGRFWALSRSNIVRTPRFGFSDALDEEWMIPDEDFWRLVGAFGQGVFGESSLDLNRRGGDWFLRNVSSDGASQFSLKSDPSARKAVR